MVRDCSCQRAEQLSNSGNIIGISRSIVSFLLILSFICLRVRADHENDFTVMKEGTALVPRTGVTGFFEFHGYGSRLFQLLSSDNTSASSTTTTRPLAVKGGRRDPFDSFHAYRGGYNIKSRHYWGSLAFTGIPGYGLAVAWILVGLLLALSLCCANCCYKKRLLTDPDPNSSREYVFWLSLFVVFIVTILTIGICILVFVESREFRKEAKGIEDALIVAGNNASDTIDLVTAAISNVEQLLEPFGTSTGVNLQALNSTQTSLTASSEEIERVIRKNTDTLDKIINYLEIILLVCTSVSLAIVILGPVCGLLGWKRFFYLVVTVGWIVTALTCILFGINYALSNLVADTCDAINEYQDDPLNTTLNSLLPCEDLLSQSGALVDVATEIRASFSMVNNTFNRVRVQLNQTLPPLCEPIGPPPAYNIESCDENSVPLVNLPQLVQPIICSSNNSRLCNQQGKFLTDYQYKLLVAYVDSVRALLDVYPSIDGLTNCSLVVNAFRGLLDNNCGPTKRASHLNWGAILALATAMIVLIISWIVSACLTSRQRKLRKAIFPVMPVWHKGKNGR